MADAVALDPGPYGGTYKLIAGFVAGDFANTISYPETASPHEWLAPASNVERWMDEVGVTTEIDDPSRLIEFREAIRHVLLAAVDDTTPDEGSLAHASRSLQERRSREFLTWDTERSAPVWRTDSAPTLEAVVARSMMSVLEDNDLRSRLGACRECRWIFLDETRNRSRTWCDPADCGNRARQRRYAARHDR